MIYTVVFRDGYWTDFEETPSTSEMSTTIFSIPPSSEMATSIASNSILMPAITTTSLETLSNFEVKIIKMVFS